MSWELQPFRFVGLHKDDHARLQSAIQTCLAQNSRQQKQIIQEQVQVERFRAW